ncbi:hypothetical protein DVH05_012584 [Phytophthora capsici]|nr:hypothetical protein DVH05_012584 [Phytophthora capsici]
MEEVGDEELASPTLCRGNVQGTPGILHMSVRVAKQPGALVALGLVLELTLEEPRASHLKKRQGTSSVPEQ